MAAVDRQEKIIQSQHQTTDNLGEKKKLAGIL
jgi:hypothetical protein